MTKETHYLGHSMVVVLDKPPHDDLLEAYQYMKNTASLDYDPVPYSRLIRELVPECLDESISITPANFFEKVLYDIPLPHGRVHATLEFVDHLEDKVHLCFNNGFSVTPVQLNEYKQQFRGKSGAIINGDYRLGRETHEGLEFNYHLNEVITALVVNAFCRDENIGQALRNSHYQGPLRMSGNEVRAMMKDLTLEKLSQADSPVSEFFEWVRQEMPALNTIRELLIQARGQLDVSNRFKKLHEEGKILIGAEIHAHDSAQGYFFKAKEIISACNLTPPKNNRMEYLVAD